MQVCNLVAVDSYKILTQRQALRYSPLITDPAVHGILVQLPLPAHISERRILDAILQHKDVDGLHPLNVAQLANTKTHAPGKAASAWSFESIDFHVSCTPQVSE